MTAMRLRIVIAITIVYVTFGGFGIVVATKGSSSPEIPEQSPCNVSVFKVEMHGLSIYNVNQTIYFRLAWLISAPSNCSSSLPTEAMVVKDGGVIANCSLDIDQRSVTDHRIRCISVEEFLITDARVSDCGCYRVRLEGYGDLNGTCIMVTVRVPENGTAIIPKECRPMTVPSLIGTASGDRVETSTASPMTKAASPMKSSDSPTNHNGSNRSAAVHAVTSNAVLWMTISLLKVVF